MIGVVEDIGISVLKQQQNLIRTYDDIELIAASLKEKGILHPLLVRPQHGYFEIISGNRRFLAAKKLGWRKLPCQIVNVDERAAFEIFLIENIQRKTLNPIEEAKAFKRFVDDFGYGSVTELSRRIMKSQEYVSKRLKLLELPEIIQAKVIRRRIRPSVAEELAFIKDEKEQSHLARLVLKQHVTIKKLREFQKSRLNDPALTNIPKDSEWLVHDFDKTIALLKVVSNQIAVTSLKIDNDWFLSEQLEFVRHRINSAIDSIIREKKKRHFRRS